MLPKITSFQTLLAATVVALSFSGACWPAHASPSDCKPVYSDSFGTIFVEGSPFSIGKSSCTTEGVLHVDLFGNVYCGNSPFSIGKLKSERLGNFHLPKVGSAKNLPVTFLSLIRISSLKLTYPMSSR